MRKYHVMYLPIAAALAVALFQFMELLPEGKKTVRANDEFKGCLGGVYQGKDLVDRCSWIFQNKPVIDGRTQKLCELIPFGSEPDYNRKGCKGIATERELRGLALNKLKVKNALPEGFDFTRWWSKAEII